MHVKRIYAYGIIVLTVDRSASATTVRRITPPREDQSAGVDGGEYQFILQYPYKRFLC